MDPNDSDYCDDYDDGDDVEFDEANDCDDGDYDEFDEPIDCDRNGSSCKMQVITRECLSVAQREDLQKIMDMLSVKEHQARTLLIHHRWNVERVFEVFVEKGRDRLYAEACVVVNNDNNVSSKRRNSKALCEICLDEVRFYKMTTMDCGHCFCNDCWTEHFVVKINEGQSRRISCMALKCSVVCDEDIIRSFVSKRNPELAEKFDRYLLESYIEDNKMVKWCPSVPHCGNAIRVGSDDDCWEVECSCGVQFCFKCTSEAHSPCSCQIWERWLQKCKDESETSNWITVHTKNCPKCYKPVEKNGGCNLVRCICGQPFCWLCGGPTGLDHTWTSISGHKCGGFKEEYVENAKRAQLELVRYGHYHGRFKAHTDSLKAEITMMKKLEEKIENIEKRESASKDYDWVRKGAKRLFRSRRFLSYSYPFAFYVFTGSFFNGQVTDVERSIKQNLFEDQQQQLEGHVEKLSGLLEEGFDDYPDEKLEEFKKVMKNLPKVVDTLCQHLYDCIDIEIAPLLRRPVDIAPYRSMGADKAMELEQ